jgi:beta-galactosidase
MNMDMPQAVGFGKLKRQSVRVQQQLTGGLIRGQAHYQIMHTLPAKTARSAGRALTGRAVLGIGPYLLVSTQFCFVLLTSQRSWSAEAAPSRERVSFNMDWRFAKGDPAGAETKLDYQTLKPWLMAAGSDLVAKPSASARPPGNPGSDVAYAQADFDDSKWRVVRVPHDWGIEGPFKQEYPGDTGKLPWWGVGWYRKHFSVPASDAGRQFALEVDGAMAYASVWLNGQFVGGWPYGYASWRVDLTPYLKPGADNVLAIRLDNPPNSSRWYPGGGLYRNVWLVKTAPVRVAHWGTFVTTPEVSRNLAMVRLQVRVENRSDAEAKVQVVSEIFEVDAAGARGARPVATFPATEVFVPPGTEASATATNSLRSPRLWSLARPNRYVVMTSVVQDGQTVDMYETPFGVRTLQFTPDNGFLLNGERVAINGVCNHHDLGALGAAINLRALERQVELLKEMGCNAIRTSHNPPAPELLDVCDRLGMVVMDEAFDCWVKGKTPNDYHLLFPDWHEKDLRALVRRDRNHPCVVLWSIGNEVPDQGSPEGPRIAGDLAAIVHAEDPTRPVTAGCDNVRSGYNGFQKQLDVFGYNYKPGEYGKFRQANPAEPLVGSETASCISSRGEYFFPVSDDKSRGRANFQVSSYDLCAPPWATTPDTEFRGQDQFPFTAGEFVWTGFDYLGEPTPYNMDSTTMLNFTDPAERARMQQELADTGKILVPSRSSYFGIIDLAGFKKDRFYIYQARWRPEVRMAHILPHWTWPEREGKVTPVQVYTSGDEAELFLNGKSLGRKKRGPMDYRLRWDDVVYQPGELKVVASRKHMRWAEEVVRTAGSATKLAAEADRTSLKADGEDLCYVTVKVTDWAGRLVPRMKNHIFFETEGPGEIIAVDNGDATSFEPFQAKDHSAYNGLCLAIIRTTGKPGPIIVKATSPGLAPVELKVHAKEVR